MTTTPPANSDQTDAPAPLAKAYRPTETEPAVWSKWLDANAFHADPSRVTSGQAPPYSILIPPPNVTAALHLGHALNNTIQDILIRAHRMKGFETLWMPGTDHAGIATQTMVDKRLREADEPALAEHRKLEADGHNGREKFTAKVQAFKDEFETRITDQLKAMGCSCDYERQRFTMDEVCARAVREAFFRLFKDGLIERGKRLVNWDPVTQTALADDEVEMEEVEGSFWYLRYPLVDDHGNETDEHVTVATTRPETYFGDTGVAVNPSDPKHAKLIGRKVKLPFVGRIIPIVGDDYVVMADPESSDAKAKYASGFLKVTPAHDPNDWLIGQRHDLDVINIMSPDASISDQHGWEDVGDAQRFVGLSREDARTAVEAAFRDANLLEAKKPYSHSVGHSYRSHAPIEPYLSDQWYCRVTDDRLRGNAQRAVTPDQRTDNSLARWPESTPSAPNGDGRMTFHPARYAKTYETWHDNLRDWCISRQLWWGHRIPVWTVQLAESDQIEKDYSHLVDMLCGAVPTWQADLFIKRDSINEGLVWICPRTDEAAQAVIELRAMWTSLDKQRSGLGLLIDAFAQDPDVLDTWFSSALWPLSTMGWPDASAAASGTGIDDFTKLLEAFNPSSTLTTAREIITLWVSRMAMFNRYFLGQDNNKDHAGPEPFKDVFIHAMIQDGEGRKMSKSLGNGVDPLDIIASHGADAMRFTLCQMTTQTQDVRMPVEHDEATGKNTSPKFDIGRNLCNKLWNASRFALSMLEKNPVKPGLPIDPQELSLVDRWMLSRVVAATASINAAVKNYQFKDYADALYDLLWRDFCDWYLESIKPTLATDPHQPAVLRLVLDAILRLMHPVTPFITEALHERVGALPSKEITGFAFAPTKSTETLCQSGWPEPDAGLRDDVAEDAFDRMRSLVTAIREVRASMQVPPKRQIVLHADAALAESCKRWSPLVETLAGVKEITTDAAPAVSAALPLDGTEHRLSDLTDQADAGAEKERLQKELDTINKSIKALEGRLSNPGYTDKAPAHLVDQTRAELASKQQEAETIAKSIEALG